MLVWQAQGQFWRHLPRALASEARGLQPGDVRGRGGARSAAQRGVRVRCGSAWAKARWPAAPLPGIVAMCSSARVGVGEGAVACRSTARRRGDVFLGAGRRGRRRGGLQLYRHRAAWGAPHVCMESSRQRRAARAHFNYSLWPKYAIRSIDNFRPLRLRSL